MKITGRQEEFIRNLLDLYQENREPLHYTALAERLGVNRFTAYDMLRLLEEKGLAASEYRLTAGKSGPGRSEVVFRPTRKAHELVARLISGAEGSGWEALKASALETLRRDQVPGLEWGQEFLARLPDEAQEPLRYCREVMTVIAMRLRAGAGRRLLLTYLPMLLPQLDASRNEDLTLLGGFGLGVLAAENADDPEWCLELFSHVRRYQALIGEMSAVQRQRLAASLYELYSRLGDETLSSKESAV